MGLQCIGEAFGGKVVRSPSGVMHGKSSLVYYDEKQEDNLFAGLSNPFTAGRYHSLVIEKESFPVDELEITAWTEDGLVMAARHKKYKHLQMESDELIPIDIEYEREDLDLEDELDEVAELPPPKKAKTKSKNKTNNEDKKRRTSTIWRFF